MDVPRNQEAKKLPWYDGGNRKYYCDFTLQFILNITMLLGWVPMTNSSFPFLSYTGSGTLVTYFMTGLVLSIYRNKSIVRDPKPKRIVRRLYSN